MSSSKETLPPTTDYELRALDTICINESKTRHTWFHHLNYLIAGALFGIIIIKAEMISWFRIQEMFRFQSFHMYGIIGSAVLTGLVSVLLIKTFRIKTIYGEPITFNKKKFNRGQIYGGLLFGLGWGMIGACPGPLFAQIGFGATVMLVPLLSAVAGTWIYGFFREKLPH
ncbi:DUF6691 family protein [Larkinella bovis]|uniref:DUF6691 family protein n=1 Tax=Larkinella bovis TaxID=683041 RepID=A0ABW0IES6_9BACT